MVSILYAFDPPATIFFSFFCLDCGSAASSLRIAGGLQVDSNQQWPGVALAVSDTLQCTANIGKEFF